MNIRLVNYNCFIKTFGALSVVFFLSACVRGEPELNRRQARQIDKVVEYKVDSFRKAQQGICYELVLETAIPKADSIIRSFEMEASTDTVGRPERPVKPERPKVEIPEFED